MGSHSGTLQLEVCPDAACSSPYPMAGGEIPYELTVVEPITVTVLVNGVPREPGFAVQAVDGDLVRLESSEPCWFSIETSGAHAQGVTSTTTTWEGTLRYSISTPGHTGTLTVNLTSIAEPRERRPVTFAVPG